MKNIFISSTFRDMHAERDLVQERVLPALRAEARKYGDNVEAIDLRWGVDTSTLETDEGSAKVLTVCLDEIDRSHPYMLIFLGERYGWIPKGELIEKAVKSREDKYITDDFEKSVTALEIEYGALSEQYGDIKHCVVCFREPVTEEMDEETKCLYKEQEERGIRKLQELKERIRKDLGDEGNLITYTGTWDESAQMLINLQSGGHPLEEVLTGCYMEMFREDWKECELLTWQDREQLGFKAIMESKLRTFVGREELLDQYYGMVVNDTEDVKALVLQGEVGSGKTAIMCKLIERLEREGKNVFSFFSGTGSMSTNAELLVQQMLYYVEKQLGIEEHWKDKEEENSKTVQKLTKEEKESVYDKCLERLRELCGRLEEKIYFCIDALDQLSMDEHVEKLDFLIGNRNVQMILSCTENFPVSSVIVLDIQKERVPLLNMEDAKAVAEGILRANSREIYEEIEQELLRKTNVYSPLYISFLIQRLNMMQKDELEYLNSGEDLKAYIIDLIRNLPQEQKDAAVLILKYAVNKISKERRILQEVLNFLAVSRTGLRMSDFQKIFEKRKQEFSVLDVTLLMKYLDGFFYIGEDDRIDFTHKVIRQGLLKEINNRNSYEKEMKEYIKTLEKEDCLRMQEGMYYARVTEDYDFAGSLLKQTHETESELLFRMIQKEAAEDEGEFYSELLRRGGIEQEEVREVFLGECFGVYELSQKEIEANLNIGNTLIICLETLCERKKTEKNLWDATRIYNKMGTILLEQGRSRKALLYYKKALHYLERLLEEMNQREEYRDEMYRIYGSIGNALREQGRSEDALPYYKDTLQYRKERYEEGKNQDKNLQELCRSYSNMGHVLCDLKQEGEALSCYEHAIHYAEELDKRGRSDISQLELGKSYQDIGDFLWKHGWEDLCIREEKTISYYKKALQCAENLYEMQKSEKSLYHLAISCNKLGIIFNKVGEWDDDLVYFEKAKQCVDRLHEMQKSEKSLYHMSVIYRNMGDCVRSRTRVCFLLLDDNWPDDALTYYTKAVQCKEELHNRQKSKKSLQEMYIIYQEIEELLNDIVKDEAIFLDLFQEKREAHQEEIKVYHEKALRCREEIAEHENFKKKQQEKYENLVAAGSDRKMQAEWRLKCYEEALLCKKEMYEQDPGVLNLKELHEAYRYVGTCLCEMKQWKEALTYYEKTIELAKKLDEKWQNRSSMATVLHDYEEMVGVFRALKDGGRALEYSQKYLRYVENEYGDSKCMDNLSWVVTGCSYVGETLWNLGKIKEAVPYYRKVVECRKWQHENEKNEDSMLGLAVSYCNLGLILKDAWELEKSAEYSKKAMEVVELEKISTSIYDISQIEKITPIYKMAKEILQQVGRLEEMEDYYRNFLDWLEKLYKDKKVLRVLCENYRNLGEVLSKVGNVKDAVGYYDKAIKGMKALYADLK